MNNLLRHLVSKRKRRFLDKETGLDLDLAYITPSLIAMGYPSKALEAFYRNSINDVEKFLDTHHPKSYKVYNLCSERITQFPFPDHSPPPFQLIHPFCEDVSDWLHTTAGNVVAVHCKAGKGRTGVMLCSFLVHCGATANEAIKLYAEKRTYDGCGVTIPSQLRYIQYYELFLESRTLNYDPRLLTLTEIVIDTIPKPLLNLESGTNYLILTILSGETKIYESTPQQCCVDYKLQQLRITISDKIVLAGDVKMMLWYDGIYKRRHLCHFHFNTTFIDKENNVLDMKKCEVDKACKDKQHSTFDKDFHVSVKFMPALAQQSPLPTLDSLPNRAILLKYKNHNGPNSVHISPPYFSSVKLSPPRNKSSLAIFGINTKDKVDDGSTPIQSSSPPSSSGPDHSHLSSSSQPSVNKNGLTLVHSNAKVPFKPAWSERDRDREDNWDNDSINSDYSDSDSLLEWWYTKPPRPTIQSSAGTADGTASASIVQPEITLRNDPDMRGLVFPETQEDSNLPQSPTLPHFRQVYGNTSSNAICTSPSTSTANVSLIPATAYRSPPHSASSPLAREVKFDSIGATPGQVCKNKLSTVSSGRSGRSGVTVASQYRYLEENNSLTESYLNEEGERIGQNDKEEEEDDDEGRDSGVEDVVEPNNKARRQHSGQDYERDRGWVDSVSRWLWRMDGNKEHQGPYCAERI
ncbi:hypothetical protein BGZ76_002422 [Entomortierella beljakovae]|nr:hypothetical protein BGZ76_002422 [Entomortierella beljakovae]